MLIDKEARDALERRLRTKWMGVAKTQTHAHAYGHSVGRFDLEQAVSGAAMNTLQVVLADLDFVLRGFDPSLEPMRPLRNELARALLGATEAIDAYLGCLASEDVDDAMRFAILQNLETTLQLVREHCPPAKLAAAISGDREGA